MKRLPPSSTVDDIFLYVEKNSHAVLLFVDDSKLCVDYMTTPWVKAEAEVVPLDLDILETFQVGKVPQYRFFKDGSEIKAVVGTIDADEFLQAKREAFGKEGSEYLKRMV